MMISSPSRCVLIGCAISAVLGGCGAPGAIAPQIAVVQPRAAHRGQSWMLPEARQRDLLYVSNWNSGAVTVYTYPEGSLVGTLTGFTQPYGECVDKSGDVFITNDNASSVLEYPHGSSSPIATISDAGEHPAGCSIDPITGDLAVNNAYTVSNQPGSISLYRYTRKHGWSFPETYSDSSFFYMYFCGYDNRGNLFVDGYTAYDGTVVLAVLPAGHKTFTNLSLQQAINIPGGIMWDGRYMTVADSGLQPSVVYRFVVKGSAAEVIGTTSLSGSDVVQYWVEGNRIVGPQPTSDSVGIWSYPPGGQAIATITQELDTPSGLTISRH
ncbi:MAG: YncE family protein [Candidatus Cybelea sp.]